MRSQLVIMGNRYISEEGRVVREALGIVLSVPEHLAAR